LGKSLGGNAKIPPGGFREVETIQSMGISIVSALKMSMP
jgi:hypothetical protein